MADALNARGIVTSEGRQWRAQSVKNLLARQDALTAGKHAGHDAVATRAVRKMEARSYA